MKDMGKELANMSRGIVESTMVAREGFKCPDEGSSILFIVETETLCERYALEAEFTV